MDAKDEGPIVPQVPLHSLRAADSLRGRWRGLREPAPPCCGVCGAQMLTSHGHGLCLRCGFLARPEQRS